MYPKAFFPGRLFSRSTLLGLTTLLGLGLFVYYMHTCRVHYSFTFCKNNHSASEWPSMTGHRVPKEYFDDLPVCSGIIHGDMVGKKDEIAQLLHPKKRLSEESYLSMTKDCKAYIEDRGFITVPLSAEESDFPIAYSMVIHADVEMFERLLRAVYNPQNVYCVHVDAKSPEGFHNAVRAIVSCFPNVFIASTLERVVYASWSRVQADLNCMKDLMTSPVQWRYLLNTCGSDLPIKTNAEMVQALKMLNGKNNLESLDVPDNKKHRWQYHHKVPDTVYTSNTWVEITGIRKTPPPIPMFSGNAYFVVTRGFVKHVLENEEIQRFMEWNRDTYSPDEHLWASLNRMSSVPGSEPGHSRYHRSDMQAIARLVLWSGHAAGKVAPYHACTSTVRRDLCVYGAGDLQWIFQQHHLMANKFDPEVDDIAIRCIESILRMKALHEI